MLYCQANSGYCPVGFKRNRHTSGAWRVTVFFREIIGHVKYGLKLMRRLSLFSLGLMSCHLIIKGQFYEINCFSQMSMAFFSFYKNVKFRIAIRCMKRKMLRWQQHQGLVRARRALQVFVILILWFWGLKYMSILDATQNPGRPYTNKNYHMQIILSLLLLWNLCTG